MLTDKYGKENNFLKNDGWILSDRKFFRFPSGKSCPKNRLSASNIGKSRKASLNIFQEINKYGNMGMPRSIWIK
jgi:hypothetical protein